jgi:hypothetical protein
VSTLSFGCYRVSEREEVDCATCRAKGRLEVTGGEVKVVFNYQGRKISVLAEEVGGLISGRFGLWVNS